MEHEVQNLMLVGLYRGVAGHFIKRIIQNANEHVHKYEEHGDNIREEEDWAENSARVRQRMEIKITQGHGHHAAHGGRERGVFIVDHSKYQERELTKCKKQDKEQQHERHERLHG